jgi:pyrimidine-nucleoside phosphorylase
MRAVDIITKKRDKGELSRQELEFFIQGFNRGEIPDYQASAWAMAVLLNGMTPRETTDLTMALVNSGEMLDCTVAAPVVVDKHSTGGVGDKTTLVVQPVVAACGLPVGKISGRGLGFSGGTLDKIESIPGCRVDFNQEDFLDQLGNVGVVLSGQTADLAPADGKLYALRDVTGTVQSIPLIASSIMSKKIAGGANAVLLDVKVGSGAFMNNLDDARELAELMVAIAEGSGRKAIAILSDMNQPLGQAVGNALEVKEVHDEADPARTAAESALENGEAWEKFKQLISAQGGDTDFIENPDLLPKASLITAINSPEGGYLSQVDARIVGETAVVTLGAGRAKKGEPVDHAVGIEVLHKVGDFVKKGEAVFILHANDETKLAAASQRLISALDWSKEPVEPLPQFYGVIGG